MDRKCTFRPPLRRLAAFALAIGLCIAATSQAQRPSAGVSVAVFSDRYELAGQVFDHLDRLESAVMAQRPRMVALEGCEPGATRALKAATHRFRHLPLQLSSALEPGEGSCPSQPGVGPMHVGLPAGGRPFGIDDEAVERYWREILP